MQLRKSSLIVLFLCLACGCITASAQSISFAAPYYIPTCTSYDFSDPGCYGGHILTGDFNGDGKLDLVISGSNVVILLGNGDGTFQQPVTINTDVRPTNVGSFNHDGKLDLLALSPNTGGGYALAVLLGNGDGTFQPPVKTFVTLSFPGGPTTGYFNNNGKLDVAIHDLFDVKVFLGNGDGTFQTPPRVSAFGVAGGDFATADFNLDGKVDLIAGTYVALGKGGGTFELPVPITDNVFVGAGSWAWPGTSVVADFDGDGKPDVAVYRLDPFTAVRLKLEENQLVDVFGEIGVLIDGLKGA